MHREPPESVKQVLREEVGSCCPVADCGSPHLTWHHFDPPWHIENHHRPAGMIALCLAHHKQADTGGYTIDQLKGIKSMPSRPAWLNSRFEWRRQEMVAVVGGNFYHEVLTPLEVGGVPIVQLNRDCNKELLVSLQLPGHEGPKVLMKDNQWIAANEPGLKVTCPPSARLLKLRYTDGTRFRIEFRSIASAEEFDRRYPAWKPTKRQRKQAQASGVGLQSVQSNSDCLLSLGVSLPTTTVEIDFDLPIAGIRLRPRSTRVANISLGGSWASNAPVGLSIG